MKFTVRQQNIVDFNNEPAIPVMIASLKTGGTGLNLTAANKCILVEPWWNEAVGQQVSILCRFPFDSIGEKYVS